MSAPATNNKSPRSPGGANPASPREQLLALAALAGIPTSPDTNAKQILDALAAKESQKRKALEDITGRRESALNRILELEEGISRKTMNLRRRERALSVQAGQLLRALKSEETRLTKLSAATQKVTKTKKHLLSRIAEPAWAVPHHYHMTAIEHTSGHVQPHVMDVGSMIRGHLRIYAIANSTTQLQKTMTHVVGKAKTARVRVSEQIKTVYRELRTTRAVIKDYEKMMDAMRERLGGKKKKSVVSQSGGGGGSSGSGSAATSGSSSAGGGVPGSVTGGKPDAAPLVEEESGELRMLENALKRMEQEEKADAEAAAADGNNEPTSPTLLASTGSMSEPSSPLTPSALSFGSLAVHVDPASTIATAASSSSTTAAEATTPSTASSSSSSSSSSSLSIRKHDLQISIGANSSSNSNSNASSPSTSPRSADGKLVSVSPPSPSALLDIDILERVPGSPRPGVGLIAPPALNKPPGPSSRGHAASPKQPSSPETSPERQQASPAAGYRNIKMRFFQALNLAPPVVTDGANGTGGASGGSRPSSASTSSTLAGASSSAAGGAGGAGAAQGDAGNGTNRSSLGASVAAAAAAGTASPEEVTSADWREVITLFQELEPIDKAKQAAWEELETVLDVREKLKFELSERGVNV